VSRPFLKKLDSARDGLSHSIRGATMEQVLEAALDLLLEKQARARGLVKRPRATLAAPLPRMDPSRESRTGPPESSPPLALISTEPPPSRRAGPRESIPAAIRRAVWERDGGRCTWPLDGGGCCGSTHRLELDHVVPWARGGESTVENLRLTCHRHNAFAARQTFGSRCVDRYAARPT
jgi:HNH endonuclease